VKFKIKGKPSDCSREYVRAWLHASAVVLAYHNKILPSDTLVVLVEDLDLMGSWTPGLSRMELRANLDPEDMATTILHEIIHAACGSFGTNTEEKCCSTLCSKLKPEVHKLAQVLIDGTYKRAAYIAHTKLSYITDEDHYDEAEDRPIGVKDKYKKGLIPA